MYVKISDFIASWAFNYSHLNKKQKKTNKIKNKRFQHNLEHVRVIQNEFWKKVKNKKNGVKCFAKKVQWQSQKALVHQTENSSEVKGSDLINGQEKL